MVYAQHLKCCTARYAGSTPALGTKIKLETGGIINSNIEILQKITKALEV